MAAGALNTPDRLYRPLPPQKELIMVGFAVTLLIIAAVAAILGFGGIAGALADVAILVFVLALVVGLVMLVLGWKAGKAIVD